MEKPSSSCNRAFMVLGILLSSLLTGCVDLQIRITFQNPDQGTLSLTYTLGYDLLGLQGPGGMGSLVPLPTTRAEAQALASGINGLQLVDGTFTEVAEGRRCVVNYRFANPAALQTLVQNFRQSLTWTTAGGQSRWTFAWNQTEINQINPQTKNLAQGLYGKNQVSWDLQFPRNLVSSTAGQISGDRRRLTVNQTWTQIFEGAQALQILW